VKRLKAGGGADGQEA